jgi:CBS domain-containing protein
VVAQWPLAIAESIHWEMITMLIKQICMSNVVVCGPQTSALQAASLMRHRHVGDVVVVDNPQEEGMPLGVVTDRDLVVEVLGKGLDPAKTTVGSLMGTPVVIARESEDTALVIERMRTHGVRRVPVVTGEGTVVAIVTLNDLLKAVIAEASALLQVTSRGQLNELHGRR